MTRAPETAYNPWQMPGVLIVDDHAITRDGMVLLLRRIVADVEIHEAGTLQAALEVLAQAPCELILLDYFLPDASGDEPFERVLAAARGAPVVILSGDDDPSRSRRLLKAGARGYVPKSCDAAVVQAAIELVLKGGTYLPEFVLIGPEERAARLGLTPRQHEVLKLLVEGLSNKEIAVALGTSLSTVRAHISGVFLALGVDNRTRAAQTATTQRLV